MNKILLVFLGLLVATVCNAQPSSGSGPTGGGGGGLASLVSDTSPQLGGFLDVQTHGITNNAEGIGIAIKTTELSFFGTADFSNSTNLVVGHGSDAVQIRGVSGSNNGIIDHPLDTGDLKIRSFESGDTSGDLYLNDVAGGDVFIGAAANTDAVTIYGSTTFPAGGELVIAGDVQPRWTAMSSTNVDWTATRESFSMTGNTAFDLNAAGAPDASGDTVQLQLTGHSAAAVITFDQTVIDHSNDRSISAGTTINIGANANVMLTLDYDGTNYRVYGLPVYLKYFSETFTILEPDAVRGVSDDLVLKKFVAEEYPNGVTIEAIHIDASAAYTSETFLFEHWDNASGSTQATVESITASAISTEDDGTLSDATIPADYFLVLNFDDTPEDVAYVAITIRGSYEP